jgi:hypothetical protein
MSATARKHDALPGPEPIDPLAAVAAGEGTEYATRGARAKRAGRPHLRMVSPLRPERASRGLFALIVTGLLGIGMVLILVINTSLAQGAFTVSELKAEQAVLAQQEQTLAEAVAAAAAPESLEQQARALGMVPTDTPVFLAVPSGEVLGTPKPAAGARSSVPRLLTPADATVTEAVDNGGADLPVSPGADYDPAAVDAAAAQAAAANAAVAADPGAVDPQAAEGGPADGTKADAKKADAKKADGKKADAKKKVSENSLWQDATVIDLTGKLSSEDAGLVAVPVP